jgi:hypothetical protein
MNQKLADSINEEFREFRHTLRAVSAPPPPNPLTAQIETGRLLRCEMRK